MNRKLLLLVSLATSSLSAELVTPTYVVRSQGSDAARKLAGVSDKVHLYDIGRYVNFAATLEYSRSFAPHKIARSLFGDDIADCNKILIQGSAVAERDAKAWFADYFYLAPDYNSYFSVTPRIYNVMADLDLFVGFDDVVDGLYLRIHGPITQTNWNLDFEEQCDIETTGSFNAGYFDSAVMFNNQLLNTFGQFAQGQTPLNTVGTSSQPTIGIQFIPLHYAKIDTCSHSRTGFADLRMELGWDFAQNDDYHFGLNVQIAAPTGNRTQAEFAFDPTVGNRNHWEAGGGLSAHYVFWRAQGEEKHAGFYLDVNLTHMNNAHEQRTFDLCNRPNSRYMLAMNMGNPVSYLQTGSASNATSGTTPNSQFQSVYSPVANLTTLNLYVRSGVQADLALMFNYSGENFSFDLGYNFWARTAEKFSERGGFGDQCCPNLCNGDKNQWALKGDARVFGFLADDTENLLAGEPIALSATECGATIHGGTNASATGCPGISTNQNCGVDNPQYAFVLDGMGTPLVSLLFDPTQPIATGNQIQSSLQPLYINCCDINLQSTRGLSNKVFAHLSYTWDKESWAPYIGVGGFAEFGKNTSDCNPCNPTTPTVDCSTPCDNTSCEPACCTESIDCSVSQWGVWLKGGLAFGETYERARNSNTGRSGKNMNNKRMGSK